MKIFKVEENLEFLPKELAKTVKSLEELLIKKGEDKEYLSTLRNTYEESYTGYIDYNKGLKMYYEHLVDVCKIKYEIIVTNNLKE